MTNPSDWNEILVRLENKNADTFSDAELVRRAAEEIRKLREQLEVAERRISELSMKLLELMKEVIR
jgi:division protein CdvB (Snf7/Vps24/ESCRT-III family)